MEAQLRNLEQTVDELSHVPDPFDVNEFPHLPPQVLDLARELRGPHTPQAVNRQVRIARVLDGLRRVEWRPHFTALSRQTGMRISTVFDHVTRLRKYGMYAEIRLHVPGGPVIHFVA